jgi:hypothetical protein
LRERNFLVAEKAKRTPVLTASKLALFGRTVISARTKPISSAPFNGFFFKIEAMTGDDFPAQR